MFSQSVTLRHVCQILIAIALTILTAVGCGGGTTGTGEPTTKRFVGKLKSPAGAPLDSVEVVVLETGDSAVSDAAGAFVIETMLTETEATLALERADLQAVATLTDLPAADATVTIELEVDVDSSLVTVISITISELDTEEPDSAVGPTPLTPPQENSDSDERPTKSIFSGQVLLENGAPAAGAQVTVENVGASDTTDKAGRFSITTKVLSGDVTLRVEFKRVAAKVTVNDLPNKPVKVEMTLELALPEGDIGVDSVDASLSIQDLSIKER